MRVDRLTRSHSHAPPPRQHLDISMLSQAQVHVCVVLYCDFVAPHPFGCASLHITCLLLVCWLTQWCSSGETACLTLCYNKCALSDTHAHRKIHNNNISSCQQQLRV